MNGRIRDRRERLADESEHAHRSLAAGGRRIDRGPSAYVAMTPRIFEQLGPDSDRPFYVMTVFSAVTASKNRIQQLYQPATMMATSSQPAAAVAGTADAPRPEQNTPLTSRSPDRTQYTKHRSAVADRRSLQSWSDWRRRDNPGCRDGPGRSDVSPWLVKRHRVKTGGNLVTLSLALVMPIVPTRISSFPEISCAYAVYAIRPRRVLQ